MAIYFGVVRDNHIELEGNAHLAEGTRVEVHAPPTDAERTRVAEEMAKARLRAAGLLASVPPADDDPEDAFEPVMVNGELLSEQILRERR